MSMDIPEKELTLLRGRFTELNPKLFEKIERYEKEGSISYSLGSHHYDYIHFSEILKKGFQSTDLHYLFELLIYVHFFEHICLMDLQISNYIKDGIFDKESYLKVSEHNAEIILAIDPIKQWCREAIKAMGIKEDLLESERGLLETLKVIQGAKDMNLHHWGDYEFIASKIPLGNNSDEAFDGNLRINHNIFYSNSPEQIIQFAAKAEKGIYVIANVPYGKKAETAFYILFRQENYAYLIENNKHSYRDQIYRGKCDGTPGEDAWLDRKYERILLPVEVVMAFFSKENESKDVVDKKQLDFIPIGKLDECSPYTTIWLYSFVDLCIGAFKDPSFIKEMSMTVSPEFVVAALPKEISQLPAIYKGNLPIITEIKTAWSPDDVEVEARGKRTYLEAMTPQTSLTDITLPKGKLTSFEQIRKTAAFEKRKISAHLLQETLRKDFLENFDKVQDQVKNLVLSKDKKSMVIRALKNDSYSSTNYVQFCDSIKYPDGFSKKEKTSILYGWHINASSPRTALLPPRKGYLSPITIEMK